jgi:hypothetical protein
MHAALKIDEVLAMIVSELRDSKPTLTALCSTNQQFFRRARAALWEELPEYAALARLMPEWSWRTVVGQRGDDDGEKPVIVRSFFLPFSCAQVSFMYHAHTHTHAGEVFLLLRR